MIDSHRESGMLAMTWPPRGCPIPLGICAAADLFPTKGVTMRPIEAEARALEIVNAVDGLLASLPPHLRRPHARR